MNPSLQPRRAKCSRPQVSGGDADLASRIRRYWSCRAENFARVRHEEVCSERLRLWQKEIVPHLPPPKNGSPCRVLDVGTGAGFFAVLLTGEAQCDVTGIDLCPDMLREARRLARATGCRARFLCMDATALDFAEHFFDCVLVRNLTWTLLQPEAAYAEWLRVLRPGGVLLNFDADYGAVDFTRLAGEQGCHAHADLDASLVQEGETIRRRLPLSREKRPQWDMEALRRVGFSAVEQDSGLSERVYRVRDSSYNPVQMFVVRAMK